MRHYADPSRRLDAAVLWGVEAHLESCAGCRARLASVVRGIAGTGASGPEPTVPTSVIADGPGSQRSGGSDGPASAAVLLERVEEALSAQVERTPAPVPVRSSWRRWLRRGAAWSLVPWTVMTTLVLMVAALLDLAAESTPSLVALLSPVAPLLGVATAWSRRGDAGWETVAASARAGLGMLLRRTVTVLVVVVPLCTLAGWVAGSASLGLWLVPCLALTAATLALGGWVGVDRAAAGVGAVWTLAVVAPTVAREQSPVLLDPSQLFWWVAFGAVAAVVVVLRSGGYRQVDTR
ncbi:MAG: hypothetical protein ACRCY8_00165 [Dermatophilaceae bacterium]